MKAMVINRFGEPDVFEAAEIDEPAIARDEILVKVFSGSINPVDWKQRRGNHKLFFGSKFPIVLGYDIAGRVVKAGEAVHEFKAGDAVCGVLQTKHYGQGLAEMIKGPVKCFSKIPDTGDVLKYGVLPLAGLTSLQALRDKGNIQKGHKILIIGAAGGVGHFALQIARILGAETVSTSSARHENFLREIGPTRFIDYQNQNIRELKESFDIIYDSVGKYSFLKCRKLLKPGGIYINTLPRPKILIHKFLSLFTYNKRVKGILMKHSPEDLSLLVSMVSEGKLKLCIDKEFSIYDISKAHSYSEEGHTEGKILVRYDW